MDKKQIQKLNEKITEMTVSEFYNLVYDYQVEGKMGRIRFPKWIKELHKNIIGGHNLDNGTITSQLIDILNCPHLNYCEKKILFINSPSETNGN